MTKSVKAIYENGVFRPLEPVSFKEQAILDLTVSDLSPATDDLLDTEFMRSCEAVADERVTIEQVRQILSRVPGSMAEDIIKNRDDRV
jgi:predicted DNA-binding antitoxin AbrB/MazE fold protein